MPDVLQLTVCGHIGKVQGIATDHHNRAVYRFSLCCNFRHGRDGSQLWLQCSVREPGLLQLCLERGVYMGEKLLIVSHEATLVAALYRNGMSNARKMFRRNKFISGRVRNRAEFRNDLEAAERECAEVLVTG